MSNNSREKARASGWKPAHEQEAFPEHIKEWSYQLWAYQCARDSRRVAAYMRAGEYDGENEVFPPTKVADRTIRAWSQRYKWAERQLKENKALHADAFNLVAGQNINNSVDAVRVQAEMLYMVKADLERKVAWTYDPENPDATPPPMRLDPREIKAVTDLTNGILDRAGHTAWTRKDISEAPTGPSVSHRDAIGGKDMAELIELANMRILGHLPNGGESSSTVKTDDSSVIEVETNAPKRSAD